MLNTNFISMPNLNVEMEYLFGRKKKWSVEMGAGLVFYSFDENDPAFGYKVNQKFAFLYHKNNSINQGVAVNINYASYNVKTYLLTEESSTNSTYFKYQKMKLHKYRYGGNLEYQIRTNNPLFIELNVGMGIMYYAAEHNEQKVIQDAYRNGVFYINHQAMLNPILRLKIGYKL